MAFFCGHPQDYEDWRALGLECWGWDDLLPLFKKRSRQHCAAAMTRAWSRARSARVADLQFAGLDIARAEGAEVVIGGKVEDTQGLYVNEYPSGGVETPFGGYKQSGIGREKGREALNHYTQLKTVIVTL